MPRHEDGFTVLELVVVVTIISILVAIAVTMQAGARTRAADATAKANIRTAEPAFQTYRADGDSYAGMTAAGLRTTYSPGIQGIQVLAADASSYCVVSTVEGRSWYKNGPGSPITTTPCS